MIEFLSNIDTNLFLFLNGLHSDFWDPIMWFISGKLSWIPLYVVLVYCLVRRYGRASIWWIIAIALTVLLADQISSGIIKPLVERWRPSRDPSLEGLVHIVNGYRGGKFGFVSSHAANSFGVAVILSILFKRNWVTISLLVWAAVVSYSRLYLGVHYPGDIICGAIVGVFSAIGAYHLVKWLKFKYESSRINIQKN